jgi:NAD-dependent deacetylase
VSQWKWEADYVSDQSGELRLRRLAALIMQARSVFVLAGAGMSTESGILDFRGPDGLWTKFPEAMKMFDLDSYRSDPAVREAAWRMRREGGIQDAEPNAGHYAVASWGAAERQVTVATQNIDGLQQSAGVGARVLELHGTYWESMCLSCDERLPIESTFARVEAGEADPDCLVCGGILKSATVAFGQLLDPKVMDAAIEAASSCDLALAIGSSLSVQPAASLCSVALGSGAALAIVNAQATDYDELATLIVRDPIGPTLERVTELMDDPLISA